MTNMNVTYQRSCRSLLTLQQEIRDRWPGREQNKGFITGYMGAARAGQYSGHYVDDHGITYAYDIGVDIEGDGTGLKPTDAEWLAEYLCDKMNPKFQYLIHNRRIRGNHTGWKWIPYTGSSPHVDHIHVSVQDVQWGEPSGVSPAVYDSTGSWGLAANAPAPAKAAAAAKSASVNLDVKPKDGLFWTVERGDTLNKIAAYYAVDVNALARHNHLANPNSIEVGQYIRIPSPVAWTVERGDTLNKIAAYYGLDWKVLAKSNGISNPRELKVGTVLRVG